MSGAVTPASSMRRLISGTACGRFRHVHGDPHHLRAGLRQLDALLRGAGRVGRVRHRHRLHDDGRAAADLDGADPHADGPVELDSGHAVSDNAKRL